MKKYKMEIAVVVILVGLLVALLREVFPPAVSWLPYAIMALCALGLIGVLIPWQQRSEDGTLVKEGGERYAPKYFVQALVSCILGLAIILGAATLLNKERFTKTFDLTQNKVNSLSPETDKFLGDIKQDVEIYCVGAPNPQDRYCEESSYLRSLYAQRQPKIKTATVGFGDREVLAQLRPTGFSRLIVLVRGAKGEIGNRSEIVGKIDESKLTNGLINLLKSKKVVYFLSGSGEPSTAAEGQDKPSYSMVAEILKDRSYEVKQHSITAGDLPADAHLVIAGSTPVAYSPVVENMLRRFLAKGGRLVLTINPYHNPGMPKLFADLGIKLENIALINDNGATPLGKQLAQLNTLRLPIAIGDFSKESGITSIFGSREGVMLADGARPMSFGPSQAESAGVKVKATRLLSTVSAAPSTLTDAERNKIPRDGPHGLRIDANFDPEKHYPVGVKVEVDGASKLAEGLPAATLALNNGKGEQAGTDASAAKDDASKAKDAAKAGAPGKDDKKKDDKTEVVVYGFEFANPNFQQATVGNSQLLPVTVSDLYQDKDLVSIPTKDFAPKQFNLERNPGGYLLLFSGILPIGTALMGLYIWLKRRSA